MAVVSPWLDRYLENWDRKSPTSPGRSVADLWNLVRSYPPWKRALITPGASPLSDGRPWITFAAIRFLERILEPDWEVFEYGIGGSSIFFAARVAGVYSVEHDEAWYEQIRASGLLSRTTNWHLELIPSAPNDGAPVDVSDPEAYASAGEKYTGRSFRQYCGAIDRQPVLAFDLILIDGRARPSCFKHALKRVKPGGYILWDNTDREYYWPAMRLAPKGFRFLDFRGPSPYVPFFTRTSAWRAPKTKDRGR